MGNLANDMNGEQIDLCSDFSFEVPSRTGVAGVRRFLGIQFGCCDVYARIYLNVNSTAYEGHCPKCAKPVRINVGPGGTQCRFFAVY